MWSGGKKTALSVRRSRVSLNFGFLQWALRKQPGPAASASPWVFQVLLQPVSTHHSLSMLPAPALAPHYRMDGIQTSQPDTQSHPSTSSFTPRHTIRDEPFSLTLSALTIASELLFMPFPPAGMPIHSSAEPNSAHPVRGELLSTPTLNICDNDSYNQMSAPKRHYCYFPFHKSLSGLVGGRVSYPLEHFLHRNNVRLPRWKPHGVVHTDYY